MYFYRRQLPHVRVSGATYFVTWRIRPEQPALIGEERSVVASALKHFNGTRYELAAYVVMDDHVHVIVTPHESHPLEKIIQGWKSFTSKVIQRMSRREAGVWQAEYFDRIIRSAADFNEKLAYIMRNASKRWPHIGHYEWLWVAVPIDAPEARPTLEE